MLKRILSLVLSILLIMLLGSCNAIETGDESESADREVQSNMSKTPINAYRAAELLLKSITNYEISLSYINHITYSSASMDSRTDATFKVDGDNVYYSYAENQEIVSERWFVDNFLYQSVASFKEKVAMTAEEYKINIGMPTDQDFLLELDDSDFDGVEFEQKGEFYALSFEISKEAYKEYTGVDLTKPGTYVVYFDSNETFVSMNMITTQMVYGYLLERNMTLELKNVGTTAPINAPESADEYRVPVKYEDIDFSAIDSLDSVVLSETPTDYVKIDVKDKGSIVIRLYPEVAPVSVANFKELVSQKFYDGLIFHRVIKDFMIQGGCPEGNGSGGSDEEIVGEFASNGFTNNLLHKRGVLSMARSNDPDSASSQFFIVHKDSSHLNGEYAAFGYVIYGMDVVDSIAESETENDKPTVDVVIESIRFVTISN